MQLQLEKADEQIIADRSWNFQALPDGLNLRPCRLLRREQPGAVVRGGSACLALSHGGTGSLIFRTAMSVVIEPFEYALPLDHAGQEPESIASPRWREMPEAIEQANLSHLWIEQAQRIGWQAGHSVLHCLPDLHRLIKAG